MRLSQQLSDTAFLVNESRARRPELSRDRYARSWVPQSRRKAVSALWDDFAAAVYPHDDVVLGVRTRWFLATVDAATDPAVVVNLGAGLVSYPYLAATAARWIEVDLPHVAGYKRTRTRYLLRQGAIPPRAVTHVAVDLTDPQDRERLGDMLGRVIRNRRSVVLIEGLSYYLAPHDLDALLSMVAAIQTPGSVMALDHWPSGMAHAPVFARLQAFFARRFGHAAERYHLFDIDPGGLLPGYRIVATASAAALERSITGGNLLDDPRQTLDERYARLVRTEEAW